MMVVANEDALSECGAWCNQFSPFGFLTYHFWNVGLALQLRRNIATNHSPYLITAIPTIRETSYSHNISKFVSKKRFYINRNSQPLQQYEKPFSQLQILLYRCQQDPKCVFLSPSYCIAFNSLPQHPAPSSVIGMIVFELLLLAHFLQDTVLQTAHLTLRRLLRQSQCMSIRLRPFGLADYDL